ncbi:anthranilate synthase component I family protein [Mucilaginibacter psychrotolerans]|uniref:Anthranilate synthase component I family protein n=1 Tax=Mucilaginibacter psychrotolerans TaxID=1524096 RepID=A0A4Y8SKB8_9SPHI|nr:anthranilate synthase component I family protein [Mucilaginibacter psychrotolerans]TFF39110.1 anthranilate synthase component I family protein [Mucilaginibacter psychrotolerans]
MIFDINDPQIFKEKALDWAATFDTICYLDSNNYTDPYGKFDTLIAIGVKDEIKSNTGDSFKKIEDFRRKNAGFITGFFGYDLKNEVENLASNNPDGLQFPDLYFFAPQIVITINRNTVEIIGENEAEIFEKVERFKLSPHEGSTSLNIQARFSKAEYVATVEKIKAHIAHGDIYVTNFCQEFYADNAKIDPLNIFNKLNSLSPTPFASYFKWKGNHIICASPERFLAKRGSKLISQPIKGTARRDEDKSIDQSIKQELRSTPKELQENVMIVDLVRNDLTHSAKPGTVMAEELFGIHSFKQVHQMVSTVVCELHDDVSAVQAVMNTFPMGSMTGAPKISAMQLMEQYERSKRGVYSGAIGYFAPDGDFDFNVVIRTLLYNSTEKYLSFHVGGAVTYHADPQREYEECLLKAKAILEVLGVRNKMQLPNV